MRYYDIDIFKLNNGTHSFQFDLNDQFFEKYNLGLFEKGAGKVDVILEKSETMINATFKLNGSVELICDRSLEPFDHTFSVENKMVYKFGDEEQELDDDITIITHTTQSINVAQPVYDFIGLTIPIKKVHPDLRTAEDDQEDEEAGTMVYTSSANTQQADSDTTEQDEEEAIDPRWQALKNLKR
ncbi:DUF177 domain-containing protein [Roseivirga sp. BDSF3-8]|uniref:YceD family protein n=1 Tax=Roseivirga sp. BDSF3-8 TaxID=3241598 RepID=UPI003531B85D